MEIIHIIEVLLSSLNLLFQKCILLRKVNVLIALGIDQLDTFAPHSGSPFLDEPFTSIEQVCSIFCLLPLFPELLLLPLELFVIPVFILMRRIIAVRRHVVVVAFANAAEAGLSVRLLVLAATRLRRLPVALLLLLFAKVWIRLLTVPSVLLVIGAIRVVDLVDVLLNISLHHDQRVELLALVLQVVLPDQETLLEVDELLSLQVHLFFVAEPQIQRHILDGLRVVEDDRAAGSVGLQSLLAYLEVCQVLQSLCIALHDEVS